MATETEINIRNMEEEWTQLCKAYETEIQVLRDYLEQLLPIGRLDKSQGVPPNTPSRFFRW